MDLAFLRAAAPALLDGAAITVALAALALVGAVLGGCAVAGLTMSRVRPLRWIGFAFVEVMRNTPILVQVFVLYFGMPTLGLTLSAFNSAALALTLQNSAYLGEIYRAGIESIPAGQRAAAIALGMRPLTVLVHVLAPQALRRVLPPLGNQLILIVKDTSIASTIAVTELTQAGKLLLDRSAAPYETLTLTALCYLAMSATVAGLIHLAVLHFPVRT
jgi:polar amino acid transport system permease protein